MIPVHEILQSHPLPGDDLTIQQFAEADKTLRDKGFHPFSDGCYRFIHKPDYWIVTGIDFCLRFVNGRIHPDEKRTHYELNRGNDRTT